MDEQLEIFFNTTNLKGGKLKSSKIRAGCQNEKILTFSQNNPEKNFTPFEVHAALGLIGTPITSIRRAITTLTNLGYLYKTNIYRDGNYGEKNHTWKLNK